SFGGGRQGVASSVVFNDEFRSKLLYDPTKFTGFFPTYFHRAASPAEVSFWVNQIHQGVTDEQVIAHLLSSVEYTQIQGNPLTDTDWIKAIYREALRRTVDAAALAALFSQLAVAKSALSIMDAYFCVDLSLLTALESLANVCV